MKYCAIVAFLMFIVPSLGLAIETKMEFGVRGGVDNGDVDESFKMGEVYFQHVLPWQKEFNSETKIYTRLDMAAGVLEADSEKGKYIAAGADVVLSMSAGNWEVEAGCRPIWISEYEYGQEDFGGPIQFISHVGTSFIIGNWVVSYRFLHMSNADLYHENGGVDLHMVGLGRRF